MKCKIKNNILILHIICFFYPNNIKMDFFGTKKRKKEKRVRTKKKFQKMNCSPIDDNERIHSNSCFTQQTFMTILKKYNEKNPNNLIQTKNLKKAWKTMKNRLSCQKESCWLNQLDDPYMKKQVEQNIFAPKHPPEWKTNPNEWLSNFDIRDVAKQYEKKYKDFLFIGPTTIDFDTILPGQGVCVLEDLCTFSLEEVIRAGKTKIGIVFNLDKHYQGGSHWVSMFIDVEKKFIFFFDSADNPIPQEIWKPTERFPKNNGGQQKDPLVNRIVKQGRELVKPIEFTFYNNSGVEHQQSNTECGMYSLFFVITMLTGKTPFTKGILSTKKRRDIFLKDKIPDEVVFKYRSLYFNE